MRGKGLELDSDSLPNNNKCGRKFEEVDRISELPDDIIVHILSFLPLKEAVATSILSPRWSHLWRYTPILIFQNNARYDAPINIPVTMPEHMHGVTEYDVLMRSLKNTEWVNTVLNSHKALSLKKIAISFFMHESSSQYQVLAKWLHFALSRQVEDLKLSLPCSRLILDNVLSDIRTSEFKFLRKLKLKYFIVSGEAIELFIRNCPLLERLAIQWIVLMSDLVVTGRALKHLVIKHRAIVHSKSTTVYAPNLTRLICNHNLSKLFLENVPNLVEASFDLYGDDTMDHFAKAAAKLEILTIKLGNPKVFPVPQMPKLKKFVLDYTVVSRSFLLPVTCLLQKSPCLQEFRIEVGDVYRYYLRKERIGHQTFVVPKDGMSPHHHLKVFEFSGFCVDAADHMQFLSYVVDNCVALEEIIIITIPCLVVPDPTKIGRPPHSKEKAERKRHNRYVLFPSSYDKDVLVPESQDAGLRIKEWTEQHLAGKVPRHIKLLVKIMDD